MFYIYCLNWLTVKIKYRIKTDSDTLYISKTLKLFVYRMQRSIYLNHIQFRMNCSVMYCRGFPICVNLRYDRFPLPLLQYRVHILIS